ncbi:MAG: hypothetical protein A3K77_07620 [Euryarchaeota archaeon RBG_13_31_8]|nr:MAG: hypothetical protein A3K77_07620 [Euryarchaeota archaeon RBG_13_31_8]
MLEYENEKERLRARRDFGREEYERREREQRYREEARRRIEARERELRREYEHRARTGNVFNMSYEQWKRYFGY